MQIRVQAASAALLTFLLAAPAVADRLRTYEATLARLTNIALGCAEMQGTAACRGEIQDVRDVLLTRIKAGAAEAYIRERIAGAETVVAQTKACILPSLLAEPTQLKVNRLIEEIRLRRDLVGKKFAVTNLDMEFDEADMKGTPDFEEKARKMASSMEAAMACFPYLRARMDQLRAEYDRLAVRR